MHGFFGSYGQRISWNLSELYSNSFVKRSWQTDRFDLMQITLPKFLDDKYFVEEDDCFIATEGVLFQSDSHQEAISRYRKGNLTFWDSWRGSFAGILYDKREDVLLLFNDHIGSKMLFYAQTDESLVFGSDLRLLTHTIHAKRLNTSYVHAILDIGCNQTSDTFVEGIQRLTAGQYLYISGNTIKVANYHRFCNTPMPYNEDDMIHETNRLFRQAVERVIRKNDAEGLRHFYPLSGGLDSRITQWVARQLTNEQITNFTFSQTGHYDHLLPKEISKVLGNKWLFMPLDGGNYIKDTDGICAQTEWLVSYLLPAEIKHFADQQDWKDIGVVLTGINGDNIFATETDNKHEMDRIYTQGFNGYSLGSPLIMQHYTESYSPFCDVDVLDYVLHIPTIKRRNYYFYDQFVLKCYPEAAQWHHKYVRIGDRPAMTTILGRNIPLVEVPRRICMVLMKHLKIYDAYRSNQDSMNPYDYWAKTNPTIDEYLKCYYADHRYLLAPYQWFKQCKEKMRFGSISEKAKVLTIASAITNLHIS